MSRLTVAHLACAVMLAAQCLAPAPARAGCFIACRPSEATARVVLENLIARRFHAPFTVLSFQTTRVADFDLIAGEVRGFEIFFKAKVSFPQGANLDCARGANGARPDDCSDDPYFSLIRETRPTPGRQFVEPGGVRDFDEDLRFAEQKTGWKGPDGQIYKPE
jgi:hypothetical protein